jgi:hypothetical protein
MASADLTRSALGSRRVDARTPVERLTGVLRCARVYDVAMRSTCRLLLALALVALLGACTGSPAATSIAAKSPAASPAHSAAASLAIKSPKPSSSVSASSSASPTEAPAKPTPTVGTSKTKWGRILNAVPAGFPVFPAATVADPPRGGAVSGAWTSSAPVDEVAAWYRDALIGANWAKVDDGGALEDGTHVVDAQGDLPECRAQVTVKPAGASTMVTVLYSAGCIGAGDN